MDLDNDISAEIFILADACTDMSGFEEAGAEQGGPD
jgi:hypothetical protein